jgi:hypothetical protein
MKISELNPLAALGRAKKIRKTGDGGFSDFLDSTGETDAASGNAPALGAAPATPLGGLLALQGVSEEEGRRRKALQQSKLAVDVLDGLRRDLLMNRVSPELLRRMEQQLEQIKQQKSQNPTLVPLLEEVELRLAVEKAKLELAQPGGIVA